MQVESWKRWLVGTFVLATDILYFLFMTAWLKTFLVVGYIRPLTQLIALTAIGFGASHLYELAWNRGAVTCEIGDVGQRQRTMQRIRDIVSAPIGLTSLVLVTGARLRHQCSRVSVLSGPSCGLNSNALADGPLDACLLRVHRALCALLHAG